MKKLLATLLFAITAIYFLISPSQKVYACQPVYSPWYFLQITPDLTTFPEGLKADSITRDGFGVSSNELLIYNKTSTPIYITTSLANLKSGDKVDVNNIKAEYKLVDNNSFYARSFPTRNVTNEDNWELLRTPLTLQDSNLILLNDLGYNINKYIINQYGDNRPNNIVIPEDEPVFITMVKDSTVYKPKFIVSFQLNQNYDPESVKDGNESCKKFNNSNNEVPTAPFQEAGEGIIELLTILFITGFVSLLISTIIATIVGFGMMVL